jgi:CBS domain containing-hemolysin-like protein
MSHLLQVANYVNITGKRLFIKLALCLFISIVVFTTGFVVGWKKNSNLEELKSENLILNEITDDELIEMVDTMEEQGLIDEDTQELITNAIDFIDVDAIEIMVHRTDFFAYDIDDDIKSLLTDPELLNYSRIPVYKDSIDNIVGILNTKQLIKHHLNGDNIDVEELLTQPLYVFPSQSVSSVLKELRQQKILSRSYILTL